MIPISLVACWVSKGPANCSSLGLCYSVEVIIARLFLGLDLDCVLDNAKNIVCCGLLL